MRKSANTISRPLPRFVAEIRPCAPRQGTLMVSGEFSSYRLEELADTVRKGTSMIKLSLLCGRDHFASRIAQDWLSDFSCNGVEVELTTL